AGRDLGCAGDRGRLQLWRDLRAQSRSQDRPASCPRPERAVARRRSALLSAVPIGRMSTALTKRGWRGRGIAGRAIVAVSLVIGVVAGWMILSAALAVRGIATGFDFLWRPASFQISEALFAVTPSDPIVV